MRIFFKCIIRISWVHLPPPIDRKEVFDLVPSHPVTADTAFQNLAQLTMMMMMMMVMMMLLMLFMLLMLLLMMMVTPST